MKFVEQKNGFQVVLDTVIKQNGLLLEGLEEKRSVQTLVPKSRSPGDPRQEGTDSRLEEIKSHCVTGNQVLGQGRGREMAFILVLLCSESKMTEQLNYHGGCYHRRGRTAGPRC